MSHNGFDTWTLELRGSGLSTLGLDLNKIKQPFPVSEHTNSSVDDRKDNIFPSRKYPSLNVGATIDSNISSTKINGAHKMTNSRETFTPLSEGISSFLREGWLYKTSNCLIIIFL